MIPKMIGVMMIALASVGVLSNVAMAQTPVEIPRGSGFSVQNQTECAPNADVVVSYNEPGAEPRRIGASLTDPSGHFSASLALPLNAVLGAGSITVECGIDGGVLHYDIVVVESASRDLASYAIYGAGALGALVLVGLLSAWLRKLRTSDGPDPETPPPAPLLPSVAAALEGQDQDDETEYWFWDTTTEIGPVKRLACLTLSDFYLHEVPAPAFSPLLELLATVGPQQALSSAFFQVAIADIDQIRYRGTEMQVAYRSDSEFVTRTIDLATEVDGVMDLLSRHVPIMEASAAGRGR